MTLKEKLDIYIQSYTKITKIAGSVQFWTKLASIGVIAIMVRNALVGRIKLIISQAQFDAYKDTSFLPPKEWVDGFTAMQTRNALEASGLMFIPLIGELFFTCLNNTVILTPHHFRSRK